MSNLRRFGGLSEMTPVVQNLILLNVFVFVACFLFPDLDSKLAIYYPSNPAFKSWQIVTHMFMHGGIFHILFNMYALYSFGIVLEHQKVLGSQRFAFLYLFSGLGAIAFYLSIQAFIVYQHTGSIFLNAEQAYLNPYLKDIFRIPLVGASGAIYGLLAGFGFLFPNTPLMFMFIPVPIKAKFMIPIVIVGFDIMFAQTGIGNIAHTAHIGGAIFGFLLVLFWNKTNKKDFY